MTHQDLGIDVPQKGARMANSGAPIPQGRRILEIRGQDQGLGFLPALLKFSSDWETDWAEPGHGRQRCHQAPQRAGCLADPSLHPPVPGSKPHNARAMLGTAEAHERATSRGSDAAPETRDGKTKGTAMEPFISVR